LLGLTILAGCVAQSAPPGPTIMQPAELPDAFVMQDGAPLPYRRWVPQAEPHAVLLAIHGFNDSKDAWEIPAPDWAAQGIAVYAPDVRGFGAAPGRGLWSGGQAMAADIAAMSRLLRTRHPGVPLVILGESMGGALVMLAAVDQQANADAYVLSSPAVWSRSRMNWAMQAGLWLAATLVPGLAVGRGPVRIRPSDNDDALRRLSRNPLTILKTRFDTLRGLVDLMDTALAAAPRFNKAGLFLYGAHDELIPAEATATLWRTLPASALRALYPQGFHLLTRDLNRSFPITDIAAFTLHGTRPEQAMQSGKDWLASQG
jgi:alpha-beta hydrolase superfamily lysophospholipase